MHDNNTIYRVTVRKTGSLQSGGTFWQQEVVYCGTEREEARVAYHTHKPEDYSGSHGTRCRETIVEMIEDGGSDDFDDDTINS